jgi:hypothetical protein
MDSPRAQPNEFRSDNRAASYNSSLASVYTNQDPQPSNPNQVMVIMFSVELGAVDEPHRHLKPFMKGRGLLHFR